MSYSTIGSIGTITGGVQFNPGQWADRAARCELSLGAASLAMILLGHFHHETGICWRAMKGIAGQLGKSLRSIQRYRKELELKGLLTRWQPSGRKCNRFRAVMPREVARPAPEPEPDAQLALAIDSTDTVTPNTGTDPVKSEGEQKVPGTPENKKSHARGDTPGVSPRTGNRTEQSSKARGAIAPSGFTARPLAKPEPSAKGEQARTTLRQLGVREVVVRYLALVCDPHELEWLAAETTTARVPGRYVRKLFNLLAAGLATPYVRRTYAPKYTASEQAVGAHTATPEENRAAMEEEDRTVPVKDRGMPPLHFDAKGFWAVWAALVDDIRAAGDAAWRASRHGIAARTAGPAAKDQAQRSWLSEWALSEQDIDLGHCAIDRITHGMRRTEWRMHAKMRARHMADHPELYPNEDKTDG